MKSTKASCNPDKGSSVTSGDIRPARDDQLSFRVDENGEAKVLTEGEQ